MKFCPKCGAKLATKDKFCDRCGTDVSLISGKKASHKRSPIQVPAANNPITRNQNIRKNCLLALAGVLIVAALGMVFFAFQANNNQNTAQADFNQAVKALGFKKASKIKPKDTAGLAISYAHSHFQNDKEWNKIFAQAQAGTLHVKALSQYEFADYKVTAPSDGRVVVLNDETGYVVTNISHPANSKITYVTQKGPSKGINLPTLTKKVVNSGSDVKKRVREIHHLIKEIKMDDQVTHAKASSGLADSDDTDNSGSQKSAAITWNDAAEAKLADFMEKFGQKMKQDYDEYDGERSLHTAAGQDYPDVFKSEEFELYSDDNQETKDINLVWDPKLEKDDADVYHVVSIFNANVQGPEQHITYLFCIYQDKPIVLVDQTTNGDSIKVKQTSNQEVEHAFEDIVNESKDEN